MSCADRHPAAAHSRRAPHAAGGNDRDDAHDWRAFLPGDWQACIVAPQELVEHRDYEVAAARCLGYDDAGALCYYAHGYALDEIRSDDDEEYYPVVVYSEAVHAWRLLDARWLVRRVTHSCGDGAPGRARYELAECCPH